MLVTHWLSLLKIPSDSEFERQRELLSNGCAQMRRAAIGTTSGSTPDRDRKTLRCIDPQTTLYGSPRNDW